jgi:ribosomal protein L29
MKYKELKNKSGVELKKILTDLRNSLLEMRFKVSSNQLKNIREIRKTKKTISQVLFLLGLKNKELKNVKKNNESEDNNK